MQGIHPVFLAKRLCKTTGISKTHALRHDRNRVFRGNQKAGRRLHSLASEIFAQIHPVGFLKTLAQSIFGNFELLTQILLTRRIKKVFANEFSDQQKLKTHNKTKTSDFLRLILNSL